MFPKTWHLPRRAEQWRDLLSCTVPFIKPLSTSVFRTGLWNFAASKKKFHLTPLKHHIFLHAPFLPMWKWSYWVISHFRYPKISPTIDKKSRFVSPCDVHDLSTSSCLVLSVFQSHLQELGPSHNPDVILQGHNIANRCSEKQGGEIYFRRGMDARWIVVIHKNTSATFGLNQSDSKPLTKGKKP